MSANSVTPLDLGLKYLDFTYPDIASNLALDEALLVAAEDGIGGPVLRFWEPGHLAVVLGASSRGGEDLDLARCSEDGVPVARRSSGGGTVVVGPGTLNATVVLPVDASGLRTVDVSHAFVLERFAEAIRRHGPRVEVRGLGDLTLANRKFAGSAQRRLRHFFLVHVSILYDFPLEILSRYLRLPRRQPTYRDDREHAAFLTTLTLPRHEIMEAVQSAWLQQGPGLEYGPIPQVLVDQLIQEKFGNPLWVHRF
ncbi:MAG: lipoate--protein ligase family protein [Isosphaeraceae bacterium]